MNYFKILGCILVISSTWSIGHYFSSNYQKRVADLKEFKSNIIFLRGDIRHASTPLPEAIYSIAIRNKGNFEEFFAYTSKKLNEYPGVSFCDVWSESALLNLNSTGLHQKDINNIILFGENLGYLDKNMQISFLDLYIEQLDNEINELLLNVTKKTYMFNSLGLMVGIFISIIML